MVTLRFPSRTVQFQDTSIGRAVAWSWDFGDFSSASTERNPLHEFPESEEEQTYTVTLTVTDSDGRVGRVAKNVTILGAAPDGCTYVEPDPMALAEMGVLFDFINVSGFTGFDNGQTDFLCLSEDGKVVTIVTNFGPGPNTGYKLTRDGAPISFSVQNLGTGEFFGTPSPWFVSRDGGVLAGNITGLD